MCDYAPFFITQWVPEWSMGRYTQETVAVSVTGFFIIKTTRVHLTDKYHTFAGVVSITCPGVVTATVTSQTN